MRPVGGYFELELAKSGEYHENALRLNTGRNAFEYILRAQDYKKVFLPWFTCDVMLEPLKKLNLAYDFYSVDENFEPLFDVGSLSKVETLVYNNYFGLKRKAVDLLTALNPNVIIDNSQAFFERPVPGVSTFYSPRKFFGIPDGAYLYTSKSLDASLETDASASRFSHLITRIESGAEAGYQEFKANDDALVGQPVKHMSGISRALLASIGYNRIQTTRQRNFELYHTHLGSSNKLILDRPTDAVPMVYPYLIENGFRLKQKLIENKIFVATYWPNVLTWTKPVQLEYQMTSNIAFLPVDQRLDDEAVLSVISLILNDGR